MRRYLPRTSAARALGALAAAASLLAVAAPSRADSSAWVSVNGGVSVEDRPIVPEGATADEEAAAPSDTQLRSRLAFDVGVGTTPEAVVIFGGLFRVSPTIGEHTDFAFLLRGATEGFQSGPFGVAIDLGAYARAADQASVGFTGDAVLGGPLGLQLTLGGHFGTEDEKGATALLGVDLLRMTLFRESLVDWWPNPSRPDQDRPRDTARATAAAPSF